MNQPQNDHHVVSRIMHVPFSREAIWPLLCPVREYDWISHWQCEVLHTRSGFNELGCVFRTEFPTEGGPDTWLTSRFEPAHLLEFVRTNEQRVIHMRIELEEETNGTKMIWSHAVTALNDDGRTYLESKDQLFNNQIELLEKLLIHYLDTGSMLVPDKTREK